MARSVQRSDTFFSLKSLDGVMTVFTSYATIPNA